MSPRLDKLVRRYLFAGLVDHFDEVITQVGDFDFETGERALEFFRFEYGNTLVKPQRGAGGALIFSPM